MSGESVGGQASADSCCSHPPMPVSGFWNRRTWKFVHGLYVPWAMLHGHDEQAKRNHAGQDLQRLYERHGMSACEVLAVLDDREWRDMDEEVAHLELHRRVSAFNANHGADGGRKDGRS